MYQDYSNVIEGDSKQLGNALSLQSAEEKTDQVISSKTKRNVAVDTFPVKLHYMLSEIEKDGLAHIISWQPHGRCFIVHKTVEFEKKLLPL